MLLNGILNSVVNEDEEQEENVEDDDWIKKLTNNTFEITLGCYTVINYLFDLSFKRWSFIFK